MQNHDIIFVFIAPIFVRINGGQMQYHHGTVNHSRWFVSPITGMFPDVFFYNTSCVVFYIWNAAPM